MRARWLPLAALLGFAVAVVPALAANGSVTVGPAVAFTPSEVAIKPGESVTFSHTAGFHSVVFDGSVTPFSGGTSNTNGPPDSAPWSATATFPTAGTYTFHCGYHGSLMTGIVYVNDAGTVPTPTVPIPTTTTETTPTTTTPTTTTPTPTTPTRTTPSAPEIDKKPPSLANVAPTARSFCATAGKRCRLAGVTFELTISEIATIDATLLKRPLHGSRGRFKEFGKLHFTVRIAGDNRFHFTKTAAGRRLQPGSYRLKLTATDGSENRSKSQTVSFTVR